MVFITVIGIVASVCTAVSLVPQLLKLMKEKKAENISLGMLGVLFAGLGFWIYYGFLKKDLIIIISNCFSFLVNGSLAILAIKYKKKG
ncbi:MAG: SemiSWEET transporter [Bacteroidota bacterium]